MRKLTISAIVTLLLNLCLAASSSAINLTLQHIGSTTHAWQVGAEHMATELTRLSANGVSMMIYPAGILSGHNPTKMLSQTQTGTVDIMVESLDFFAPLAEGLWSMYTPFLFDDIDHFDRFTHNLPLRLLNTLGKFDQHNLVLLGMWPLSFNQYLSKGRTLATPKDLANAMMRTGPLPGFLNPATSLNVKTVPLPASETYTAYQLGTIDSENNSIANIYEHNTFKLASNLTIWNYTPNLGLVVMNKERWDSLEPDIREMIRTAVLDAGTAVLKHQKTTEARNLRRMIEGGVTVRELSASEREAFKKAAMPIWDNVAQVLGEDAFQALLTAVQEAR